MAKYHVLGIGYDYDYYSLATAKWTNYDIEFDFSDSFAQAKALLSIKDYLCIAIVTDLIPQNELDDLRKIRPFPIVVVPPSYDAAQRYACIHFGATQYLHSFHNPYENETNFISIDYKIIFRKLLCPRIFPSSSPGVLFSILSLFPFSHFSFSNKEEKKGRKRKEKKEILFHFSPHSFQK